jgi:hypothetical protein
MVNPDRLNRREFNSFRDCEGIDVGEALASLFGAKAPPTLYKNNSLQNSKFVLWVI